MLKAKDDDRKKSESKISFMDDLVSVSTNITNISRPPSIITNLNEFAQQFAQQLAKKPSKSSISVASNTPRVSLNQSINEKVDPQTSIFINFKRPPPIFSLIHKYMDENLDNYIHHTKTFLEYEEKEALIFLFKSKIIISQPLNEDSIQIPSTNPTIYSISHMQIFHKRLDITEHDDECNSIYIQYYENDLTKRNEL